MSLDVNKIIMESIQDVITEGTTDKVKEVAKEKIEATVDSAKEVGGEAKEKVDAAIEAAKEVGGEAKEKAVSVSKKLVDQLKDHPGITAGTAAAIAAGIGALALRKRLAKAAKK